MNAYLALLVVAPRRFTRWFRAGQRSAALAVLLAWGIVPALRAEDWSVPLASYRVRLGPCGAGKGSSQPPAVGHFDLFPGGFDPLKLNLEIVGPAANPVGYETLWKAEGEPLSICFDASSGPGPYVVYFGPQGHYIAPAWQRRAGLIVETRTRADGLADTWDQARKVWENSSPVLGRSLVSDICQGIHLHGPTKDFASWYSGYFMAPRPGRYGFATVSDDASFLLIDGRPVAEWPGWHDIYSGRRAQHQGEVELSGGRHKIDYLNIENGLEFSVEAAWRRPDKTAFEILPSNAFVPVAEFVCAAYETPHGKPPLPCFAWAPIAHSMVDGMALVTMEFKRLAGPAGGACRWIFDDGTEGEGATNRHVFARTGLHTVTAEVAAEGQPAARVQQTVNVHPLWLRTQEWNDECFAAQKSEVMARDLSATPEADLRALFDLAWRIEDRALLSKIGAAALVRVTDMRPDDAVMFLRLGFHFQDPTIREYAAVKPAFEAGLKLAASDPAMLSQIRLHYAGFCLHADNDPAAAQGLLAQVETARLTPDEQRLKKIFDADAQLAEGHLDRARELYLSAGNVVAPTDRQYEVRRRARLEAAKDYLQSQQYDDAERTLREIEWETPLERLGTETGILMARARFGRKEYPFAYEQCRRMLNASPPDRQKAEILYLLIEICLATDRPDEAAAAYRKLLEEHPYDEPTARAKDQWGARFSAASPAK